MARSRTNSQELYESIARHCRQAPCREARIIPGIALTVRRESWRIFGIRIEAEKGFSSAENYLEQRASCWSVVAGRAGR